MRLTLLIVALFSLSGRAISAQLQSGSLHGVIVYESVTHAGASELRNRLMQALGNVASTQVKPWADSLDKAKFLLQNKQWEEAEDLLNLGLGACSSTAQLALCRREFNMYLGHLYQVMSAAEPQRRRDYLIEAATVYESVLRESHETAEVLENLALVNHALGYRGKPIELLERSATLDRDRRYVAWNTIGDWLLEDGDTNSALKYYERAAALEPAREEAHHRILRAYRRLPDPSLDDLFERSKGWQRLGLSTANEGFEEIIAQAFERRPILAEEALVHWADLQATGGALSRESVLSLPRREDWRSAALSELLQLVGAVGKVGISLQWWRGSLLRRHTAANVLRLRAVELVKQGTLDAAAMVYEEALEVAPDFTEYSEELQGRRLVPLYIALDLISLYHNHPTLATEPKRFEVISQELLDALAMGDDKRSAELRKIHMSLGLFYAEKSRWTSDGLDNAIWNLERALELPSVVYPNIKEILARGYRESGREAEALEKYRQAAKEYLDQDDLNGAERALAASEELPVNKSESEYLRALHKLVEARRRIPQLLPRDFPEMAYGLEELDSLLAQEKLDPIFSRRQRFKILSDLGTRAAELDQLKDARRLHSEALNACLAQAFLTSLGDIVRLEKIRLTLLKEGWIKSSSESAVAAYNLGNMRSSGQVWSLSESGVSEPVLIWFGADLLKAREVAARLDREVDYEPGSIPLLIENGEVAFLPAGERITPLPGVTVTLSGQGAPAVQVTDAQGRFRFLNLSPGSYRLDVQLEGFSSVEYPNISINIGRNTEIDVVMNPAAEDVITVTAESPLLDERRISSSAISTARDPWAILQTTPGVLTDRVNVGGNESGQQSAYVGPGARGDQSVWAVDGVVITDMAALGSSPAYFDFDSYEEMQVTTGGSDTTLATPGVTLNIVTKRGTNEWRGSARYFLADEQWQSDLSTSGIKLGPNQTAFNQGNRIVSVEDYGIELGGPIVKDRLWIWGLYSKQQIDLLTIADVSDFTELEMASLKFNAQIVSRNSATIFALNSEKVKNGRNAGPTRPQPTTWNQSKLGPDPTAWKVEDTHIFSSAFYLTGMYAVVNSGFELVPQSGGGFTDPNAAIDANFIWQNNFLFYQTKRPQEQFKADASSFLNTGDVSHELKFGAGYREAEIASLSRWPGFALELNYYKSLGYNYNVVGLTRAAFPAIRQKYTSAYVQDTIIFGNLTTNIGLRYDIQGGDNLQRSVAANPAFPNILPTVNFPGSDIGFEWKTLSPRLGLTYALGDRRQTLLRASYSRFADNLGTAKSVVLNPLYGSSYAYFYYNDLNGNFRAEANEVLTADSPLFVSANYDIRNGLLLHSNGVDPDLDSPLVDEVLLGVEYALRPEFVVGLNFTFRKLTNLIESERLVFDGDAYSLDNLKRIGRLHTRDDYQSKVVTSTLPSGEVVNTTIWELKPGITTRNGFFTENGNREQEYLGTSITFNKRLSNRWMLRGNVSWQDWHWKAPDSELEDPTPFLNRSHDGDPVLQGGTGLASKGDVYINSNWSYSINGLRQIAPDLPWGFNIAANLTGREGYPIPYFHRVVRNNIPGSANVQVVDSDTFRSPDIHVLDARVEKEFFFSDFGLTLSVDVFNLLNENFVLQRQYRLGLSTTNNVSEILSPRIFRIGARLSFR